MTRVSLFGRLAALVGVLLLMASATAALALPMEPSAATGASAVAPAADALSITAGNVWNGPRRGVAPIDNRACPADIGIGIDGVSDAEGLGGYETRLGFPDSRFVTTDPMSNVVVTLDAYLGSTGRMTSGDDGTPMLMALDDTSATTDSIKFGDYSWMASPAANGPIAAGNLATVTLIPTATCGAAALELTETQLVDPSGNLFGQPTASGVVNVRSRYDVSGNNLIQSGDALLIVNQYNKPGAANCGPMYKFDVSRNGLIQSGDALLIVNRYNQPIAGAACTGQ